MSIASLQNGNLILNKLVVNNSLYSDVSGYIPSETSFITTENSSIISTSSLNISGNISCNSLDISGNITGNISSENISSSVLLDSTGDTNIAGLGFFTITGPFTVSPTSSILVTELFPFPSSSISRVICTVGPINISSGGLMVSAGVITPYSNTVSTVDFLFYNPTSNSITISSCSVILYNPSTTGGVQNIV